MNTSYYFRVIAALLIIITVFAFTGCSARTEQDNTIEIEQLDVFERDGSFAYNTSSREEFVGIVDYVFAATVVESDGTKYERISTMLLDDGTEVETGVPYTHYRVTVDTNIKGELPTDRPVTIIKDGGVSMDGKYLELFKNDHLPEKGVRYVFLAYVQRDGSLLISGPYSNIEIEGEETIEAYREAYENEVPYERTRFTANLETN